MHLLAFETSCDETSVAVVREGVLVANVVSSQIRLHEAYGGVVPELAAREHLRNLPSVARTALREADLEPAGIDAVAATLGPGLPQSLMIGARAAQAYACALDRPFLGIHHHEAHLYSPWIVGPPFRWDAAGFEPNLALIASGGHTLLVHVVSEQSHRTLGATLDDAAGECFDKVAKLLGLPYPGGPAIDRLASEGNPAAFDFPRPLLGATSDDFSFSGLKTSVRTFLERHPGCSTNPAQLRDVCASVQAAIVDVLVGKLVRAAVRLGVRCVSASGGVTCNRAFRHRLESAARDAGLRSRVAHTELCTDNAGMVGMLADRRLRLGFQTPLDAEIRPNWALEAV